MAEMARVLPWGQDESEFVTELQAGSELAFDGLVTHYHAHVYNLVYGMVGNSADAADVTQEVFLKVFRGIRAFRSGSSLKTWLYRIAVREALNWKRWLWRHVRGQFSIDADPADNRPAPEFKDLGPTPFDQLAAREAGAAVRQALRKVPVTYRSAVILRDLEGLSYEEVSEVLDLSIGTTKSRIVRGRYALREILEGFFTSRTDATSAEAASAAHNAAPVSATPEPVQDSCAAARAASGTAPSTEARLRGARANPRKFLAALSLRSRNRTVPARPNGKGRLASGSEGGAR